MANSLCAAVIQFPVGMDIAENLARLMTGLEGLEPGTLAVAPEGVLSGYLPRPGFVNDLDPGAIKDAVATVRMYVAEAGIHLVVGGCLQDGGRWMNSALFFGPNGQVGRYDKINLAMSERGDFCPGNRLPVFPIDHNGRRVTIGIQMCREIRYPEQWHVLAKRGVQIIAYVNNAVGGEHGDAVWRAHLISRAAETQRFVLGANNCEAGQKCPSAIIAPSGSILAEAKSGTAESVTARIDLEEVSDRILGQSRRDVVSVRLLT